MKRSEKTINERAHIDAIIRDSLVCRLAMAVDNEPYVVPISFGYDGECLYFHTGMSGRKLDFIHANSRVCFEFERGVDLVRNPEKACNWSFSFESVIGYGTVVELTDPNKKKHGLNQIMIQYSGSEWSFDPSVMSKTRAWCLTIDSITGKRSGEDAA